MKTLGATPPKADMFVKKLGETNKPCFGLTKKRHKC